MFVCFTFLADMFIFFSSISILVIKSNGSDLVEAASNNGAAFYLVVATFIFGWCLGSLSGFHLYLVSIGLTTNEEIKFARKSGRDTVPGFTEKGCLDNWNETFCFPIPDSQIDLDDYAPLHIVKAHEEKKLQLKSSRYPPYGTSNDTNRGKNVRVKPRA